MHRYKAFTLVLFRSILYPLRWENGQMLALCKKERRGGGGPTPCQAAHLHCFICPSLRLDEIGRIIPLVQMRKLGQNGAVMSAHSKRVAKPTKPRSASVMPIMSQWAQSSWEGSQALCSVPICWPALQIPSSLLCCFGLNPGA